VLVGGGREQSERHHPFNESHARRECIRYPSRNMDGTINQASPSLDLNVEFKCFSGGEIELSFMSVVSLTCLDVFKLHEISVEK
jgi:hypothetical protein